MAEQSIASWSPEEVIASGKQLILSSNYEKVAGARKQIDETIFKWVEFLEESASTLSTQMVHTASQKIVTAWIKYAELEIELRQFKQATKVFESAVSCPVASKTQATWLRYAQFCIDRKKHSNARKVFVRAMPVLEEQGQEDLTDMWQRFLAFVQAQFDPKMTLQTLQTQLFPDRGTNGAATATTTSSAPDSTSTPQTTSPPAAATTAASNSTPQTDATEAPAGSEVTAVETAAESTPTPSIPPAATPASTSPPVSGGTSSPSKTGSEATSATGALSTKPAAIEVDPSIAFVDTTGASPRPKRDAADDLESAGSTKKAKTAAEDAEPKFFLRLPVHLPLIPGCPHLLFDKLAEGEHQREIANDLVEKLSDVLGDSAVFEGVTSLRDNQRKKDRDMLYRWQELVATQMKEGCELFQRHVELEKNAADTRQLIELKSQHLGQRREFVNRCQMSQQQFIEISEMDRINALEAQQISMENLKIPEMKVSKEPDVVALQRAIVGLILEAEKMWREENSKAAAASNTAPAEKAPGPMVASGSAISESPRPIREAYVPQDVARGGTSHARLDGSDSTHSRSSGGFRDTPPRRGGGGGGRRGSGGGGNSRRSPPPYSGGAARASAMAKRDVEAYSPAHTAAVPTMHTQAYDPRLQQQQPPQLQLPQQQQQPPLVHTSYQQPPMQQAMQQQQPPQQYEEYAPAYAEEYDPDYSAVYDPQQPAMNARPGAGMLRNQAQAPAPWRHNASVNANANAPPMMTDYNTGGAGAPPQRYGGRPSGGPPSRSQGSGGPSQRRASPYGNSGKYANNAPPSRRGGGGMGGVSRYGGAPPSAPNSGNAGGYNEHQYGDYNYAEQQQPAAGGYGGGVGGGNPYRPAPNSHPQASPYQPQQQQQQQMHAPPQRTGRVTGGPGGYRGSGGYHGGGRRGGYGRR